MISPFNETIVWGNEGVRKALCKWQVWDEWGNRSSLVTVRNKQTQTLLNNQKKMGQAGFAFKISQKQTVNQMKRDGAKKTNNIGKIHEPF